ncbi:MAG: molybdopterin-dependent oxidoreductase [Planctomycetes bacterium]|nr:molybdopterin-dependent oxidoreductase [Planctomycetota bacterium]
MTTIEPPAGDGMRVTPLEGFPPFEKWSDWTELDAKAWPRRVEKHYSLIPTICFNCEAACGLVAYVDHADGRVRKVEGNPYHPGSRGRNCAKGPATINQVNDPDRILYPMKRKGPRGSGEFERVTWDQVLDDLAGRIRTAIQEGRLTEVMYHIGRPGADGYMDRILQAWGVDGHNSHTNVCSASARLGYSLMTGHDRPSPDYANAKFILLISAHLETGHYFNPHAQRIQEAKMNGAKIAVMDVRLSNTASMADHWIAPRPGTEAFLLLGVAKVILDEGLQDDAFLRDWADWRGWLRGHDAAGGSYEDFLSGLRALYEDVTPEAVAEECGIDAEVVRTLAHEIGAAGSAFSAHVWRSTASANEGGWCVARNLQLVSTLVGAVGSVGGTNPNGYNKFVAKPFAARGPQQVWSELLYPREWPLSHHELSFLLPHLLKSGRGRLDTYFTRVYNPVWTNPDGLVWIEALRDESLVGCHAALTPVWNETARWADYVLPMGVATERHDLMSQETHAAKWIGFRQPVLRRYREAKGERFEWTWEANPGEVWEEDEFWIALSWRIDPDGSLGIREFFESPYRPGERVTIDEYYRWIFENSVPGLPEAAAAVGETPYEYMQKRGAFLVEDEVYDSHAAPLAPESLVDVVHDEDERVVKKDGKVLGVVREDGTVCAGFPTPSKRIEIWSSTMAEWKWPELADPCYVPSHVREEVLDRDRSEFVLNSTFRLPTLIHTRSANSKWLTELSNTNPVWIHPSDARRMGVRTGDLVKVETRIGHYVNKAWVTDGVRPGVVACSHHLGRFRQRGEPQGVNRWQQHESDIVESGDGVYRIARTGSVHAFESDDPDSKRVWWREGGVHQNFTFPVQPDPVSGMHCWHQKVRVTKAGADARYGDTVVDTNKSMAVFEEWLARTRPAPGPDGLRRPLHFKRVLRPVESAFLLP